MEFREREDAVVHVLSQILGRTPESIREDGGYYAAYHWDDGFMDVCGEEIDWTAGHFDGCEEAEYPFWGRSDFDPERTLVLDNFSDAVQGMGAELEGFVENLNEYLYFKHVVELIKGGHVELDFPMVYGKIKSGRSLVEVAIKLFLLDGELLSFEREDYEVDEPWQEMIDAIEPEALRHHLGLFFQDSEVARCFGARFEGGDGGETWEYMRSEIEPIACWSSGEGQGDFCIARVVREELPELPGLAPVDESTKVARARKKELATRVDQAMRCFNKEEKLQALDELLDAFDELDQEQRHCVLNSLGNPWGGAPFALDVLEKAVLLAADVRPDFVYMLRFQQGYTANLMGDQELAIDYYTQSIEANKAWGAGWYNRACEYGLLGRADEAAHDLARAIALNGLWKESAQQESYFDPVRSAPVFAALFED